MSDAVKISDMPGADASSIKEVKFNYAIEGKRADLPFSTSPIKPVKIKDDEIKMLRKDMCVEDMEHTIRPMLNCFLMHFAQKNLMQEYI